MSAPLELVLCLALNMLLALAALGRRALTPAGAAAAAVVGGGILWGGGIVTWVLLGAFFVTSTVWSGYRRAEKHSAETLTGKTARRDAVQVLANGGPALMAAVAWRITGEPALFVAAAAALAEANADTWASEAGLLSRRAPRSILGLRPVPRGRSGGVTPLGMAAAAGGAALIALTLGLGCLLGAGCPVLSPLTPLVVAAAGLAGSFLDSILGAGAQARYVSTADGSYTERSHGADGVRNRRSGGVPGVSNDVVNFFSGLAAALGACLVILAR